MFIHFLCLQNWLAQKVITNTTSQMTQLIFPSFECEICKKEFPLKIKTRTGQSRFVVDFGLPPESNYLVLEVLANKTAQKVLHILKPLEHVLLHQFKIGRANDADVLLQDISTSRNHFAIEYDGKCFKAIDRNSKFGTLVMVKDKVSLSPYKPCILQIGRTIFNLRMEPVKRNKRVKFAHANFNRKARENFE